MMTPQHQAPGTTGITRRSSRLLGGLIAGFLFAPLALAADNPGAHEHGQAQLQMALENGRIDLMFSSPAYNLAGFEHQAHTEEQRALLADIRQWLATMPLVNNAAGVCRVAAASVQLGNAHGSHHRQEHHQEHHRDNKHHPDGDGHHHDETYRHGENHGEHHTGKAATHRDYAVTQQLDCAGITVTDALSSPLPDRFPALEALAVEWVGPAGQGSTVMTGSDQSFTLDQ